MDEEALNIAEMRTIRDFEKALIVVTHGFKDVEEYYDYFSPARIIRASERRRCLVARDDPFVGEREQCEHAIRQTKHVALAHVEKGGHVAFLGAAGVFGQCWTDRVLGEFLASTLERRSEAAEAAAAEAAAAAARRARTRGEGEDRREDQPGGGAGGGGGGRRRGRDTDPEGKAVRGTWRMYTRE